MPNVLIYDVLEMMSTHGGSFVQQLAKIYQMADRQNQLILHQAFSHVFKEYAEMAILKAESVKS